MLCGLRRGGPIPAPTALLALLTTSMLIVAACEAEPASTDDPGAAVAVDGGDGNGGGGSAVTTAGSPTATAADGGSPVVLSVGVEAGSPAGGASTSASGPSTDTSTTASSDTSTTSSTSGSGAGTSGSTTASRPAPSPGSARVVGSGTAASCTSDAVVAAVAAGGLITFDCGPSPVTITMTRTAKVVNANGPEIVIDGGNMVTLSGGGRHRILYQNTCDEAQGWTTSHCQNQDHPRLTVRNITLTDGDATGERTEGGGGGAIFVRGGRLRIDNVTFLDNRCDGTGPDVGGAAVRALSQYDGLPVEVSGSTFRGGVCSNGGAVSSIGVSWVISDSVMTGNRAIGSGANPARAGTPGGGSGGAIYADGNDFTIELRRTRIEDNRANEGGGAVFFVSNDRTGRLSIADSTLVSNPSDGFETSGYPGIFFLGAGSPATTGSTLR